MTHAALPHRSEPTKDDLGRFGEELAARHLTDCGMTILDRNWRCRDGEIDIVARDGTTLVVCEVKTRSTVAFGSPIAAVTPRKVRRMRGLALAWIADRGIHAPEIRFDVVGILARAEGRAVIEHLRGVA